VHPRDLRTETRQRVEGSTQNEDRVSLLSLSTIMRAGEQGALAVIIGSRESPPPTETSKQYAGDRERGSGRNFLGLQAQVSSLQEIQRAHERSHVEIVTYL